ncbi:MAG: 50S ribosomal protein L24 [Clostridiales bacterium]|nr:50S ribosomal protein L24 [Clostridiales bacterium]HAW15089.1 50S ribosomal protein L24 [Clostridiales bacterium]
MSKNIHIKKDDQVIVISGKDKGSSGKVLKTVTDNGRVYVEGVNMVKKHQKARSQNDPSGIIEREGSVDASNVMLVCPKCGKATRVAHKVNDDGSKERVCKKCGAVIDQIKKASKGE